MMKTARLKVDIDAIKNDKHKNKIKDKIEVSVNYKKEKPEVKIDLKKDYQLIKRRKEIFKKHIYFKK